MILFVYEWPRYPQCQETDHPEEVERVELLDSNNTKSWFKFHDLFSVSLIEQYCIQI